MKSTYTEQVGMTNALSIEIFITNRCSMDCSYCSSRYMIHEKDARRLSFEQLKVAFDALDRDPYIKKHFGGKVHVDLTGGEPLIEYETIKQIVAYVRANLKLEYEFELETNGTLLTEERIKYLIDNKIEIRLSLDGYKAQNDKHRRFRNASDASAYEAIIRKMKMGLIGTRHMDLVYVGAILDAEDFQNLPKVMDYFKNELGFRRMEIGPSAYELWDEAAIARLRKALRSMTPELMATLEHQMGINKRESVFHEFLFTQSKTIGTAYEDLAKKTITLFYDGCWYMCDFVVKPPLDPKFRVGELKKGIDFGRIRTISRYPMFKEIYSKCEHRSGFFSPVEGYYWGVVHKFTPKQLDDMMWNTSNMNKVLGEEVGWYTKLQKTYYDLYMKPGFGDFGHDPKHKAGKEMRTLRLSVSDSSDIVRLRAAVDFFLYSPGDRKRLVMDATDNGAETARIVEGMVLYSLVKTGKGYLDKKLRLMLETDAKGFDDDNWRFLDDHGVQVGIKAASRYSAATAYRRSYQMDAALNTVDSTYAVPGVTRRNARNLPTLVEAAVRNGCRWVRLELSGREDWRDADIAGLRSGMEKLGQALVAGIAKGEPVYLLNFEEAETPAGCPVFADSFLADGGGDYRLVPPQWRYDGRGVKVGDFDRGVGELAGCAWSAASGTCAACARRPAAAGYDAWAEREFSAGLRRALEGIRYLAAKKKPFAAYLEALRSDRERVSGLLINKK